MPRFLFRLAAVCGLACALLAPSAAPAQDSTPQPNAPYPAGTAKRIVSLWPSITEDLFAIGAGADVVASSTYTDYPPAAKALPVVSSFSTIDVERLTALHPDLVIGSTSQTALVRDVTRIGIPVLLIHDESYDNIFSNLELFGHLTGHEPGAKTLVRSLRARTAAIVARVKGLTRHPHAFVVLNVSPIYTVGKGSYIATLLNFAGLDNAASNVSVAYAPYDAEAMVVDDPDALVTDAPTKLSTVLQRPPWASLRAVRAGDVFSIGDADLLERPGPRYNDGLEWLVDNVTAKLSPRGEVAPK